MVATSFVPNSFCTPNAFVDKVMFLLTPEEWVVLSYVCRQILGWKDSINSREKEISLSTIEKGSGSDHYNGCGLSRPVISTALEALSKFKILQKIGIASQKGQRWRIPDDDTDLDYAGLQSRLEQKRAKGKRKVAAASKTSALKRKGSTTDVPPQEYDRRTTSTPSSGTTDVPLGGTTDVHINNHIQNHKKEIPPAISIAGMDEPDSQPSDFFVKKNGVAIQADSYADAQRIAEKGGTITQRQALKDELIEKNKQGQLFKAWVDELGKENIPPAFAYKPYMRFMLSLVKDGYDPADLTCAASLFKAWLKSHPARVSIDWSVAAVTTAIRRAIDLCKSGICSEDITEFVKARYAEVDKNGRRFWAGKLVKFDHVAENVANWKAERATPSANDDYILVEVKADYGIDNWVERNVHRSKLATLEWRPKS
jgi:hypothetical protein